MIARGGGGGGVLHCFGGLGDFDGGDDHHSDDGGVHQYDRSGGDGARVHSGGGCVQCCQHH